MKTLEELYTEVMASDELKKEFISLKPEQVAGFAEKHGCKATLDEIRDFLTKKNSEPGELSDDEIEQAAGGKGMSGMEAAVSICTLGVACAVTTVVSVASGNSGTAIEDSRMLCDTLFY